MLKAIEIELLRMLPTLSLKPTLERAAEAGRLLALARPHLPRGEWILWVRRLGLSRQSAADYMAVHAHLGNDRVPGHMTIQGFLEAIRKARHLERQAERDRVRAEASATEGDLPASMRIVNADCRRFKWPKAVDAVVTDPPWADLAAFGWLATWAAGILRPGGVVLCQVGNAHLRAVMDLLGRAGLDYVACLALIYPQTSQGRPVGRWQPAWRPVLLYSRGEPDLPAGTVTDGYTVRPSAKPYHDWEQPLPRSNTGCPGWSGRGRWSPTRSPGRGPPGWPAGPPRRGGSARRWTGPTTWWRRAG